MVSKVAVIALVAVIAVPILLGYALNLEETTETDYKVSGDSVNVTPLLQNGIGYNYANGDSYQLNTNFTAGGSYKIAPVYEGITSVKSSLKMSQNENPPGSHYTENRPLSTYSYYFMQSVDEGNGGYINVRIYDNNNTTILNITRMNTFYYDDVTKTLSYSYKTSAYSPIYTGTFTNSSDYNFGISDSGGYIGRCITQWVSNNTTTYVSLSAGYHFEGPNNWNIMLPSYTKSILMTIDLDSITDSDYQIKISSGNNAPSGILKKTTVSGDVTWTFTRGMNSQDLYYNPAGDNTYQLYLQIEKNRETDTGKFYDVTYELRYVGKWSPVIGESNYYKTFDFSTTVVTPISTPDISFSSIQLSTEGSMPVVSRSPTVRMDGAVFRAYEFPMIIDQQYDPASFKNDPTTTITNITQYGYSVSFGGNTYTVNDGKISISGQYVPIEGMRLSSVPNSFGTYDNKIGNTTISTTATPSSIIFNGSWAASISTQSLQSYTYTVTEWKAGEFAWDGIDHNFLIVGLITCLGAFIGCGIYARKSRSGGIIPLMIITGCAAFVFFIML